MIELVLAGALGATLGMLVALYRRMRALEHLERERAKMRQIIGTPRVDWLGPPVPEPEGRKKHLAYYRGGAAAAALVAAGAVVRGAWQDHRPVRYLTTATVVAGTAAAVVYYGGLDGRTPNGDNRLAPAPSSTAPPAATPEPSSETSPTAGRHARRSSPTTAPDVGTPEPPTRDVQALPGPAFPEQERFGGRTERGGGRATAPSPSPPVGEPDGPGGRPGDSISPSGPPPGPSASESPQPAPDDGLCLTLRLRPLVTKELCLLGDRR